MKALSPALVQFGRFQASAPLSAQAPQVRPNQPLRASFHITESLAQVVIRELSMVTKSSLRACQGHTRSQYEHRLLARLYFLTTARCRDCLWLVINSCPNRAHSKSWRDCQPSFDNRGKHGVGCNARIQRGKVRLSSPWPCCASRNCTPAVLCTRPSRQSYSAPFCFLTRYEAESGRS